MVSFLGSVPAMDPSIVIYVVIDEPQNVPRQDNSSIATKFTAEIMKELLPALGIYPEGEIDYLLPDPDDITDDNTNEETDEDTNEDTNTDNNVNDDQTTNTEETTKKT